MRHRIALGVALIACAAAAAQPPPSNPHQHKLDELARLQKLAPDVNFYPIARLLLARKHNLPVPADLMKTQPEPAALHRQMFETHTGGAAVAESLQLRRLLDRKSGDDDTRLIAVSGMPGITIAEHPWVKMMGNDRPADEPLARYAPADNYYVRFRDLAQMLAFGELVDLWGANLIHAFEFQDRDAHLRARYERQLCLPSARLAKAVRPDWIKGIAVTGSDPYLADGTDLTVIIHTPDKQNILRQMDVFIREARQAHGDGWKEDRLTFRDWTIESFTTPRREISLYRAVDGEFVLCSNSKIALQRALLAGKKSIARLSDSLDFQYMRTVFRADDRSEDGFMFLPDALIRRMMGPADKIKQKRRAEALGRLALAHSAALFAGWETGKIPGDTTTLLAATGLKEDDLAVSGAAPIVWDGATKSAYSQTYNTLTFGTPLIELDIDKVSPAERDDYEIFRRGYLQLWGQFFDPVGLRFKNGEQRVQVEAYILPLLQSGRYNLMRQVAGGEPIPFDPSRTPPSTLMQLQIKLTDSRPTWFTLRLDDDPAFNKRIGLLLRRDRFPKEAVTLESDLERAFWQLPLTASISGLKDIGSNLDWFRQALREHATRGEPKVVTHKDVTILKYEVDPVKLRTLVDQLRALAPLVGGSDASTLAGLISFIPQKEMPTHFFAMLSGDTYYLSLREDCLTRIIDHEEQWRKAAKKPEPVLANTTMMVRAGALEGGEAIRQYLEWQTHKRALSGTAAWLPLYRAGVIPANATAEEERAAALHWYGFEPISPDGAPFRYDRRTKEVVNTRHGTPSNPLVRPTLSPDAPARRMIERFPVLRTDLRFREDGIHTTVTFERAK